MKVRRIARLAVLAGFMVAALAPATPAGADTTVFVDIKSYMFSPATLTVKLGTPIVWRNQESGAIPPNPAHNLIEEFYQGPADPIPWPNTRIVCGKFDPGKSCALDAAKASQLLPRGKHVLTCTIDREHTYLMRTYIEVI